MNTRPSDNRRSEGRQENTSSLTMPSAPRGGDIVFNSGFRHRALSFNDKHELMPVLGITKTKIPGTYQQPGKVSVEAVWATPTSEPEVRINSKQILPGSEEEQTFKVICSRHNWVHKFLTDKGSPGVIPTDVVPPEHYLTSGTFKAQMIRFLGKYGLPYTIRSFDRSLESSLQITPRPVDLNKDINFDTHRPQDIYTVTHGGSTSYKERWFGSDGKGRCAELEIHLKTSVVLKAWKRGEPPSGSDGRAGVKGWRNYPFIIQVNETQTRFTAYGSGVAKEHSSYGIKIWQNDRRGRS